MKKLLLTVQALLLLSTALATPLFGDENGYSTVKRKATAFIKRGMKKGDISGISVALVDGESTVWAEGFGYADVQKGIPAGKESVYNVASITKLFTGMAIMQLVEEGRVELDSPLTDYIPEFKVKSRFEGAGPITIRQLLTHHSGLPADMSYPGMAAFTAETVRLKSLYHQTLLDYLATIHQPYAPGYIYSYSNIGYDLLAIVLERVSGKSYNDHMTERFLKPLGMERASFIELFSRPELGETMSMPHFGTKQAPQLLFPGAGSGGLNADVVEMASFIKMLLAGGTYDGKQFITADSLAEMWRVQNSEIELDGDIEMGLSFFHGEPALEYAGSVYGHSGNLTCYHTSFKVLGEHGLGVIVTTNSSNGMSFVHEAAIEILQEALKVKKGLKPPKVKAAKPVKLSAEQLEQFSGLYAVTHSGLIEIKAGEKGLTLGIAGMEMALKLYSDGRLRPVTSHPFFKNTSFKVVELEGKKRVYARTPTFSLLLAEEYEKQTPGEEWLERAGSYAQVEPINGEEQLFSLSYENESLMLALPSGSLMVLKPISESECLIVGAGFSSYETLYFSEEEGRTVVRWSGYELEKR